jgi:hypothetical protein
MLFSIDDDDDASRSVNVGTLRFATLRKQVSDWGAFFEVRCARIADDNGFAVARR